MKMLSALGVVIIRPGDGSYISKGDNPPLLDSIVFRLILQERTSDKLEELRRMLEVGMLELVIKNQTPEDIIKMEKSIQNYEKAYLQGVKDSEIFSKHDLSFHFAFTEATHNPLVIEIAKSVYQLYAFSFYKILYKSAIVKQSLEIHKMILEGIKEKNIQKTREIINMAAKKWKEEVSSEISKNRK
jgi:GntR family transcriptional repressor for pyruvate dehydrogenase complex